MLQSISLGLWPCLLGPEPYTPQSSYPTKYLASVEYAIIIHHKVLPTLKRESRGVGLCCYHKINHGTHQLPPRADLVLRLPRLRGGEEIPEPAASILTKRSS